MVSAHQHLTVYEKNELRRHHLANPSLKNIDLQQWVATCLKKRIGVSNVGKIVNQPLDATPNGNIKKKRKPQHAEIEPQLLDFVHNQEEHGLLSDDVLQAKANQLVGEEVVTMSWIQRFKARHGVFLHIMHGEAGSVDTANLGQQRTVLMELLNQYNPHDIFNMDETALFYRMLPSQTLATRAIAGRKKDEARISIGLCCNLTGTEKLEPIVVNRAAKPRCFRGVNINDIPIKYFSSTKAWMTTQSISGVGASDKSEDARTQNTSACGNAPGHAEIELNNVRIHFLPKKTTSHLQPMDAGIIRNFKLKYKKLFVQWVIEQYGAQKKLDLLTSIKLVVDAWRAVSEATIRRCWRHTRIVPGSMGASVEQDSEPSREAEIGDLDVLISRLTLDDAMSASSYIVIDDNIEESLDSEDASLELLSDSSSDEAEETSFSHAEALAAAQKLQVFMFAHGYQGYSVQKVVDVCRTMAITSKRQTSITAFFMKHRRFR